MCWGTETDHRLQTMKKERYSDEACGVGRKAGSRRLCVSLLCAAVLPAFAGSLFAGGTGTVDKVSGWYPSGTNLTVVATPHIYSEFDHWAGYTNGMAISSAANPLVFRVTAPSEVTAVLRDRLTASNSVPYQWLAEVTGITSDFENAVTNDPDNDGFTTAEEYWAGTDPATNASHLYISSVQITATNFSLIWAHSKIGENAPEIVIQSRASMSSGDWSNAAVHEAHNGINSWDSPGQQAAFYRLCVTNIP